MSSSRYAQEALRIYSKYVWKNLSESYRLPNWAGNPIYLGHYPELNVSPVMGTKKSYYQSILGVM